MREIRVVINDIIDEIPSYCSLSLISELKRIKRDVGFTSPELMYIRWRELSDTLSEQLLNKNGKIEQIDCEWKCRCFSILSTQEYEDVYNGLVEIE